MAIVHLSGYVPDHPRLKELSEIAKETLIFMGHGTLGTFIPILKAKEGLNILVQSQANIEFHEYAVMHEWHPKAFRDIGRFLAMHWQYLEAKDETAKLKSTARLDEKFHLS